jgi:hypothetical protein
MMDEVTLKRLHELRRRRSNDHAFYWALTIAVSFAIGASEGVIQDDIARLEREMDREAKQ